MSTEVRRAIDSFMLDINFDPYTVATVVNSHKDNTSTGKFIQLEKTVNGEHRLHDRVPLYASVYPDGEPTRLGGFGGCMVSNKCLEQCEYIKATRSEGNKFVVMAFHVGPEVYTAIFNNQVVSPIIECSPEEPHNSVFHDLVGVVKACEELRSECTPVIESTLYRKLTT
jgi:hypothetical protein